MRLDSEDLTECSDQWVSTVAIIGYCPECISLFLPHSVISCSWLSWTFLLFPAWNLPWWFWTIWFWPWIVLSRTWCIAYFLWLILPREPPLWTTPVLGPSPRSVHLIGTLFAQVPTVCCMCWGVEKGLRWEENEPKSAQLIIAPFIQWMASWNVLEDLVFIASYFYLFIYIRMYILTSDTVFLFTLSYIYYNFKDVFILY